MSELYQLPSGWEWKRLSSLLDVQNGYAFDSKLFNEDIGCQLIRIRDLKNGVKTEVKFSGSYDSKFLVYKGDFLIGMDGDFVCYQWNGEPSLLNQRVCRLVNFSHELHARYIFYGINKYLHEIHSVTAFVTVKHISSKQIKDIQFPVPPLAEQKRIVQTLDALFERIDKAIALLQKNIDAADNFMNSVLNDVFSDLEQNYPSKDIKSFASVGTGVTPLKTNQTYYDNGTINWITSKSTGEPYVNKADELITVIALNECRLTLNPVGTLIVALYGQGKTRGQVSELLIEAATNQAVATILVDGSKCINKYLKWYLKKSYLELREKSNGGTQQNLNLSIIKNTVVPLPDDLSIQSKIVAYLDEVSAQIEQVKSAQQQKMQNLLDLKSSILDQAFHGKL